MKQTMVRVLRDDFKSYDRRGDRIIPTLNDYVNVPRLSTYGTNSIATMLPMETLAKLAIFRRSLEGVKTHA